MQTEKIGGVYFLECPFTGAVKYVGQTSNFEQRRRLHLGGNMPSKGLKNWYDGLNGKRPIFRMVYIGETQTIKDGLEIEFIEQHAATVLNVRSGGLNSRLWRKAHKDQYLLSKR